MRFHHVIIAALALGCQWLPSTDAFTNGTMLPKYLCGPAIPQPSGAIVGADGFPKALAGVLAQMKELTPAVQAADGATYNATVDPRLWVAVMHSANSQGQIKLFTVVNDNQGTNPFVEAALGTAAAMNQGGVMTAAQFNILHVGAQLTPPTAAQATAQAAALNNCPIPPENVIPTATGTTITPNKLVTLTLQSQNNILGVQVGQTAQNITGFAALGNMPVLDGAIVYAQDTNNNRVGHFPTGGNNMAVWTACGADRNGVVHTQLLSPCTNTYSGPTFFLPFDFLWTNVNANPQAKPVLKSAASATITFMGAAVSDNGFGYHQTKWTVQQTLPDFPLDLANLNKQDVQNFCMGQIPKACWASCFDCINKAGSKANVAVANAVKVACLFDAAAGNPNAGQATVWQNATCTIKAKPTPVVPAGTLWVPPPKVQDAGGNDMAYTPDQQSMFDDVTASIMTEGAMPTDAAAPCPSNTQNTANTATSHHAQSTWFTTVALALSAVLTARQ